MVSSILLPDSSKGQDIPEEILAFTHAGKSQFLMADRIGGGVNFLSGFFSITTTGVTTFLGEMDHVCKGLAFVSDAPTCPWDCGNDDGDVGIVDFLALLAQWDLIGTPCDFDGGGVGIVDFLKLLANWGACP